MGSSDASSEADDAVCVVTASGELDHYTVPEVRAAVDACLPGDRADRSVIADFSAVTFMDSTALMLLLNLQGRLKRHGQVLAVVCDAPQVARLFSMSGFDEVMPLHPDVASARAAVARGR